MKPLLLTRTLGFVALALCIVGCAVEDAPQNADTDKANENAATESPWLVVDMSLPVVNTVITPPINFVAAPNPIPDSLADLHRRTEHAFVSIQVANGRARVLRMETKHGSIPNQQLWGGAVRYHFNDLDARVGATTQWELKGLQLVGLIKQPHGVAYQIPDQTKANLDNLKEFPTRALNEFELAALKQLQEGKNAVAYVEHDRVRLLGSIRMTNNCKACHTQADGTLLGAFTYDLARDPKPYKPAPKNEKKAEEIVLP